MADTPDSVPSPPAPSSRKQCPRPTHFSTWRLLSAGFSAEECAAIRGLDAGTIFDHAMRAAEVGLAVRAEWFLSPAVIAQLHRVIGNTQPDRIRPLLAQLPSVRYEDVQFYLKSRLTEGRSCDGE